MPMEEAADIHMLFHVVKEFISKCSNTTKSGYTFVCWVSEYNETNLTSTCAGRVTQTFYAKWAPNN